MMRYFNYLINLCLIVDTMRSEAVKFSSFFWKFQWVEYTARPNPEVVADFSHPTWQPANGVQGAELVCPQ